MRAHRTVGALRTTKLSTSASALPIRSRTCLRIQSKRNTQTRSASSMPPDTHFSPRLSRFRRYQEEPEDIAQLRVRNPLNYVDDAYVRAKRYNYYRGKIIFNATGAILGVMFQAWLVWNFVPAEAWEGISGKKASTDREKSNTSGKQRLDAPPNSGAPTSGDGMSVKIVQDKPGDPSRKIDEEGNELVATGTSTIPHFPRNITISSPSAEPSALPVSTTPGQGVQTGTEDYTLLGLGIRTVSFLSIQVYVLGMYVRTSDLDKLQSAFVRHVNPAGSSLIPSEKEALRKDLMSADKSLEIWDQVLKETGVRSAVRIVPTRGTDFAHLRDGWVTGITNRTREASRLTEGESEWDEPSFGESVGVMKQLLTGKGKAPKGSTVLLTRNERGVMHVIFEPERAMITRDGIRDKGASEILGKLEDERISRQIWMGYLGGKSVSSEGARKSIVDGIMELVERPVGTLGTQVA